MKQTMIILMVLLTVGFAQDTTVVAPVVQEQPEVMQNGVQADTLQIRFTYYGERSEVLWKNGFAINTKRIIDGQVFTSQMTYFIVTGGGWAQVNTQLFATEPRVFNWVQ